MYILMGLGNPGSKYVSTLHNIGFLLIDALAKKLASSDAWRSECKALTKKVSLQSDTILLAKPQTFMNLSGESAQALCGYYKVDSKQLIVISDDVTIPFGSIRIRSKGGHGGQNGLKNIIQYLGEDFPRIRIGVGLCPPHFDLSNYVLSKLNPDQISKLTEIDKLLPQILSIGLTEGWERSASLFNRRIAS